MTAIRTAVSLFIVLLIVVATAGWMWTSEHQPPEQALASRFVLGASALAGIGGLVAIWRAERQPGRR